MKNDIYTDIATRTGGDIYIGVVGPVRTGKSTFIKQFMEQFVIPNIESDYRKERAIDELPQSSAGKTIMTTEPKFIPEEAVVTTRPMVECSVMTFCVPTSAAMLKGTSVSNHGVTTILGASFSM